MRHRLIRALTTRLAMSLLASRLMHFPGPFIVNLTIPVLVLAAALTSSCSPPQRSDGTAVVAVPASRVFDVTGVMREMKDDGRTVVIRHQAIPGYMGAMTMPFHVRNSNEVAGVRLGDEVSFRLHVTDETSWIENVRRTGQATGRHIPFPAVPASTNRLEAFGLMSIPEFALTNEFGERVRLRDFKGSAVAMTFFFTRCPLPEYCPRLSKNFRGAIEKLKAMPGGPTNFHFLSVSFDPMDVPGVLRAYARGVRLRLQLLEFPHRRSWTYC